MTGPGRAFPPRPRGLKGRTLELETLDRLVGKSPTRLALVGGGGSGKSMLAAALGHRVAPRFQGRIHWFRIGAWDLQTLLEILAVGFGTPSGADQRLPGLRAFLATGGPRFVVLDNHEDDRATAKLLDALDGTPVTFLVTARRCLLAGVLVYPVTAPLVTAGRSAFPRVAALTRLLRWNPLAQDVADGLVESGEVTVPELQAFLTTRGLGRVHVVAHEDDVPEVSLLVDFAWARLSPSSRRMLAVLAHVEGDHVDAASLAQLARVHHGAEATLATLVRLRLVQEPLAGRYTLHAVVRYAVAARTEFDRARFYRHYVRLLEREPARLLREQTHLFAAMDHAHRTSDLRAMLRVERLLTRLRGY